VTTSSGTSVGDVFMDQVVKRPLGFAWTIPEVDEGIRVLSEEFPKGTYYR